MNYRMTKLKLSEFEIKIETTGKMIEKDGETIPETLYIENEKGKQVPKLKYVWNTEDKAKSSLSKTIDKMKEESSFDKLEADKKEELENKFKDMIIKSKEKIDNSNKVIVRDTELIRIIRTLNLDDNKIEENGYIYIKDLICISVSVPKYKSMDKDGIIEVDNIRYKRILASSGNVRNKKVIFIKEELYKNAMTILLCGLPEDMEHKQISKYNAYSGLVNSDTIPVSTPRIIVVDDFKKTITETFDVVIKHKKDEENKEGKFDVIPDQKKQFEFMPFDGAGLVNIDMARKWSRELNLLKLDKKTGINKIDYVPSSFQFRAIVGIKGNVYTCNFKECLKNLADEEKYIIDVWEQKHNIFDAKGNLAIDVILTKSQFKFQDKYDNFNEWKTEFDKEVELIDLKGNEIKYKRTFNIAKWGNNKNKEKALLSYQPIQSLELTDKQIEILCKPTIEIIKNIWGF